MRQSQLFTKTRHEAPRDEVAKNAQLLIRGGFIDKLSAGVYTYLPLGLRVLKNIEEIIRKEMNAVGGQEILMPSLHPREVWEKTGRWGTMDDLYKVTDSSGREAALGPTHEEVVTPLIASFVSSYRDLPVYVYQFQNKFRMELRAKSGILRGREFIMKDFYSFHRDADDLSAYYERMKGAYKRIFDEVGIGERTFLTYASGGSFSKYSHEFQMVTEAGEDIIYICDKCKVAINKEIIGEQSTCPLCGNSNLREEKAIEVGNIFELKTKFSEPFNATYKDESGNDVVMPMGCYGIGLGRVLGSVVEAYADERGIVWPFSLAPFACHVVNLNPDDEKVSAVADALYGELSQLSRGALYDDRRGASAGEKFNDSDLIGIPYRIIVSKKVVEQNKFEVKKRSEKTLQLLSKEDVLALFKR